MNRNIGPGWLFGAVLALALTDGASGLELVVDYTYDSQNFFSDPIRREAMEAAAARYSRVITSSLLPVAPERNGSWRINFEHPGTGVPWEISTAADIATDQIAQVASPADEYGFPGLEQDQMILFVGGRDLDSAGKGGTGTGLNFTSVFDDLEGHLHRGLISNSTDDTAGDLPVWGGAITFDLNRDWHFDLDVASTGTATDFYSIALHEIGHVLGIGTTWNQWQDSVDGQYFVGQNALDAFNLDNGTSNRRLLLQSTSDGHWANGRQFSYVFPIGDPILPGTAGNDLQSLLLEPSADFTGTVRRFELTNVDAAALVDIGWSILESEENELDLDGDGQLTGVDLDLACSLGEPIEPWLEGLNVVLGDINLDGGVDFLDFLTLSRGFGYGATYTGGDISCDGIVMFNDFLTFSRQFGMTGRAGAQSVPEPNTFLSPLIAMGLALLGCRVRKSRDRDFRS